MHGAVAGDHDARAHVAQDAGEEDECVERRQQHHGLQGDVAVPEVILQKVLTALPLRGDVPEVVKRQVLDVVERLLVYSSSSST